MRTKALWLVGIWVALVASGCRSGGSLDRTVAQVPMAGTPAKLHVECSATATQLGFAVPCPTEWPRGSHSTDLNVEACTNRHVEFMGSGCGRASSNAFMSIEWPDSTRTGHLVVVASPTRMTAAEIIYSPLDQASVLLELREPIIAVGTTMFGADAVEIVRVPETSLSALGGHTVFVWSSGGSTYAIGYHGIDDAARLLGEHTLQGVEMVEP